MPETPQIKTTLDSAIENLEEAKEIYSADPRGAWIALVATVALIESVAQALVRKMDDQ